MNKFEFISTGKISIKKKTCDKQVESSEFVIPKEYLINVKHERNVTPIRMFENKVVDFIAAQDTTTTFDLIMPISAGYRLVERIDKNPVIAFNGQKYRVYNFSYEQNGSKQVWNLTCSQY